MGQGAQLTVAAIIGLLPMLVFCGSQAHPLHMPPVYDDGTASKAADFHSSVDWSQYPDELVPAEPVASRATRKGAVPEENIPAELPDLPAPPPSYTDPDVYRIVTAAGENDLEVVRNMLAKGVDVNSAESQYGDTALHRAALNGRIKIIETLLEHNAALDIQNKAGYHPLMLACRRVRYNNEEVFSKLLAAGSAPFLKNLNDNTCLHWAAHTAQLSLLQKLLVIPEADVNLANKDDKTPLALAAAAGDEKIVDLLLQHGAQLETPSGQFKETPIMVAAAKGKARVVKLLMEKGAKTDGTNLAGETCLEMAARGGHTQVQNILRGRHPITGAEL